MIEPPDDVETGEHERRALVLAPRGRDAQVVLQVLQAQGFACRACNDHADLLAELRVGAGLALVTEEALAGRDLAPVFAWLSAQPPWSDFPLIVLSSRHVARRSDEATATLRDLVNIVLLERPLNAQTLVSAARSALRSRLRQYASRRQLEAQRQVSMENERLLQAERQASAQARAAREALTAMVADRERLLDAERHVRAVAEQASRSKDQFLATLSHELRTPLGAILGWVAILRRRAGDPADLQRGLDTIERNARAQSRLIDELLDMSRIIAGNVVLERELLMPATLLDAVLASQQPAFDAKGLRVEREVDADAGPVSADPHRLQQVVWNLVTNAVKFTPEGGTLSVALQRRGDEVELWVRDSGDGISAEFLPYVFDRFRQADGSSTRRHGGLGLGLAIVRQLAELHGGRVEAHSRGPGEGSAFRVVLPAAPAEPPEAVAPDVRGADASPADAAAGPVLEGVRVLLVDDDADGREVAARVLQDAGASVDEAASATEALERLQAGATEPADVLVSDIAMPEVDGYELLDRARQGGHALPAIALTAFARPEDRQLALDHGFALHLAKPIDPGRLVRCVRDLLDAGARLAGGDSSAASVSLANRVADAAPHRPPNSR